LSAGSGVPLELFPVPCRGDSTREQAAAALREVAGYVRRAALAGASLVVSSLIVLALIGLIASSMPDPGVVSWFLGVVAALFLLMAGLGVWIYLRRLRLARRLEEAALLVERGVLEPSDVCGVAVGVVARLAAGRGR